MRVFRFRIGMGIASLLLVFLLASLSIPNTYAGLFPAEDGEPLAITDLKVMYRIDRKTDTIQVVIAQEYDARVDRFVWLYPVPTLDAELASPAAFVPYYRDFPFKEVKVVSPEHYCSDLYVEQIQGSGGEMRIPASYPELDNNIVVPGDRVLDWMASREYRVTGSQKARLERYIADGFHFAAFELSSSDGYGEWGNIPAASITYQSDQVMLPLELSVFQPSGWDTYAVPHARVEITLISDVRYVPANYPEVAIDLSKLRTQHAIARNFQSELSGSEPNQHSYNGLVTKALWEHDRRAFDTRYAGHTKDGTYITQLYGEFGSPNNFPDAVFVPASDAPPESNEIILSELNSPVEPLEYWGCTTRTLNPRYFNEHIAPYLAAVENDFKLEGLGPSVGRIIYPEGWVKHEFRFNEHPVTVYSPESIDETHLSAYINGEAVPPMFVVYGSHFEGPDPFFWEYDNNTASPNAAVTPRYYRYYRQPHTYEVGKMLAILTSEEDFAEHEALYRALVDFPFTYQYMIHSELRHTVFFSQYQTNVQRHLNVDTAIAYPDGWVEALDDKRLNIFPEGTDPQNLDESPLVRLYPAEELAPFPALRDIRTPEYKTLMLSWLEQTFGIDRNVLNEAYTDWPGCAREPRLPFRKNGRVGVLRFLYPGWTPYIIEFSAPEALYEQYRDLLDLMESTSITIFGCG